MFCVRYDWSGSPFLAYRKVPLRGIHRQEFPGKILGREQAEPMSLHIIYRNTKIAIRKIGRMYDIIIIKGNFAKEGDSCESNSELWSISEGLL